MEHINMKRESCYVVAGGNSLKDFDFSRLDGKDVITVNKSVLDYPNCKYFVTMDHSFLNKTDKIRRKLSEYNVTKVFIANLLPDYMTEIPCHLPLINQGKNS